MNCTQDLMGIVESILLVASFETGGIKIASQDLSLKDFLEELKSDYSLSSDKRPILCWECPADPPVVRTDKGKLKHVLQNLINNAMKFTPRGTVTISARHNPEAQTIEFRVTDTGVGIPKEKLPIIFGKFSQVDGSQTRSYGGLGLGLYIVKQFTEFLGGKINVDSEPGKGSTFTVTLPLVGRWPESVARPGGSGRNLSSLDLKQEPSILGTRFAR